MLFRQLYDRDSNTCSYLIADEATRSAVLVDPVLEQVERDLKLLRELDLRLEFCLETHVHADHVTGMGRLRELTGCHGIVPEGAPVRCADRYIWDGETLQLGEVTIKGIATPGHTGSHMAYLVNGDRILTGDALLIRGCGRTDFQSGSAAELYDTVTQRLFSLPDDTLVYPAHDYHGHTVSTLGDEKKWNPCFTGCTREQFIGYMKGLLLPYPKKIMEALPANERCGNSSDPPLLLRAVR
jgi:glyoxylase-like metal-dependent hydrolase (beta-lactamase superfamily II)